MVKYQIQIKTINWDSNSPVISKDITKQDINKFKNLISAINNGSNHKIWNWFGKGGLPTKWNERANQYILDVFAVRNHMEKYFDYDIEDINNFKEFYHRFTSTECDGIEWIKLFKVEEITNF